MNTKKQTFLITIISSFLISIFGTYTVLNFYVPTTKIIKEDNWKSNVTVENIKDLEWNVKKLAKKISPSVVSIVISKNIQTYRVDPFGFFYEPSWTVKQKVWGGSGFFISKDWYILTNKHVVSETSASYTVITSNWKEYAGKVVSLDPTTDLAIIKIDNPTNDSFEAVKFSTNTTPEIWSFVIAIWNALAEFQNTLTVWVVSGLNRSIEAQSQSNSEQLSGLIQTDAAINPGNSGWPLVNMLGEVIWANTAIAAWANWLWFAIPLTQKEVDYMLKSVQSGWQITRSYMWVKYIKLTQEIATQLKINSTFWVYIGKNWIMENSPASKSGLKEWDVIIEVDTNKLDKIELKDYIKNKLPWEKINLTIIRNWKTINLDLILWEYK